MNEFYELINEIKLCCNEVIVCGHVRPDGDALGSQIAFVRFLNDHGIDAKFVYCKDVPNNLKSFVEDTPCVNLDDITQCRYAAALDCFSNDRMQIKSDNVIVNIDHHPGNQMFAKYNFVDSKSSSTCEILLSLFNKINYVPDTIAANALYAGIVTDTGNFTHSNVTKDTFESTKYLLENCKVVPHEVTKKILTYEKLEQLQLLGLFLSKAKLAVDGKISYVELTYKDYEQLGVTRSDTEGFITNLLSIKGVKVAAFIEYNKNFIKGSLRSHDFSCPVNLVAEKFGGFGHVCAAGFQCFGDEFKNFSKEKLFEFISNVLH